MTDFGVSTLSPVLSWQRTQESTRSTEEKDPLKDTSALFMTMLESASSNPLGNTDPTEGLRIMQGLVEAHSRVEEGKRLEGMEKALQENNLLQAANLVGKKATFEGNYIHHDPTADFAHRSSLHYQVPSELSVQRVIAHIFDAEGKQVKAVDVPHAPGTHTLKDVMSTLEKGPYTFKLRAIDGEGGEINLTPQITAPIEKVHLEKERILVGMGPDKLPLSALKSLYPEKASFDSSCDVSSLF